MYKEQQFRVDSLISVPEARFSLEKGRIILVSNLIHNYRYDFLVYSHLILLGY